MPVFEKYPNSRLLGLSGTLGSGKDTASDHLVREYGFMHVSTGDVIRAEARQRGFDTERPTLIELGKELRAAHGMGALSIKGIEQWQERREEFLGGLVVSGLRSVGEAGEIQLQHGTLTFIDGPPEIRYANIQERDRQDGLFSSYAAFMEHERLELHGLLGPDSPNLRAVQAIADIQIWNPGVNKEAYLRNVVTSLGLAA